MTADHDALLADWRQNAARDEDRNFRFLRSLKMVSDPDRLDDLARKAAAEPITAPHLVLDTGRTPLDECVRRCLEYLG